MRKNVESITSIDKGRVYVLFSHLNTHDDLTSRISLVGVEFLVDPKM